jgi:hypothetical protein
MPKLQTLLAAAKRQTQRVARKRVERQLRESLAARKAALARASFGPRGFFGP